jgi:hypothetical protein
MDFGQAHAVLKNGGRVTRDGWNGRGMWVALSPGFVIGPDRVFAEPIRDELLARGSDGVFRSYLMMCTADGEFVPWVASQTDLLAEDWRTQELPF